MRFILLFAFMLLSPMHGPDGDCHRPYKDPSDCRHPCDHALCDCVKECEEGDRVCWNGCLTDHAGCYKTCGME